MLFSSHSQRLWVWNWDGDQLIYDNNEIVRFQVTDEEWHDQTPKGPNQSEESIKTPYQIRGTMAREGLGVCLWWDIEQEEEE